MMLYTGACCCGMLVKTGARNPLATKGTCCCGERSESEGEGDRVYEMHIFGSLRCMACSVNLLRESCQVGGRQKFVVLSANSMKYQLSEIRESDTVLGVKC